VASDWQAATVPWLYPEMLPQIKKALNLRTTFLPLMYSLAHEATKTGAPIIRPLCYSFPDDPKSYDDCDAMMLGSDVLFSPVVEQGATTKTQYLPAGPAGWIEFHTGKLHPAGKVATVKAELGKPPIFIRAGAALVLASETPDIKPHDAPFRRLYLAVAGKSGTGSGQHFEDDGLSWAYQKGQCLDLAIDWNWDGQAVEIRIKRRSGKQTMPELAAWKVDIAGAGKGKREVHLTSAL
jgi:alpha-glucosidase